MLIFRQLFDPTSSTYSYLLADRRSHEAVLIDPVFDQARRDAALIQELGLKLVAALDTHVHADHVTGAWLFKTRCGSEIAIGSYDGAVQLTPTSGAGLIEEVCSRLRRDLTAVERAIYDITDPAPTCRGD